jgi:hypothetical protein
MSVIVGVGPMLRTAGCQAGKMPVFKDKSVDVSSETELTHQFR